VNSSQVRRVSSFTAPWLADPSHGVTNPRLLSTHQAMPQTVGTLPA